MVRKYLQHASAVVARLIAWLVFRGPVAITHGRLAVIFDPRTGRLAPVMAGGAPDPDPDPDPTPDPEPDPDPDPAPDPDPDPDPDPVDWKAMARKHEARAKKQAKDLADAQAKLKERDDADKSETEKAIAKARDEATSEVTSKYETERRAERLELAVTRHATRGVKLEVDEDGKKVEKTVKFADPDDALAHLERAIKRGEIDGDDIFDSDGKVDKDALTSALAELLEDKPHLAVREGGNGGGAGRRVDGGADAGKGKGAGKGLDELSPEEHLKQIQGTK